MQLAINGKVGGAGHGLMQLASNGKVGGAGLMEASYRSSKVGGLN